MPDCRSLLRTCSVAMPGAEYTAFGVSLPLLPWMTHSMNIATMITMRMGNSALRMNLLTWTLLVLGWNGLKERRLTPARARLPRSIPPALQQRTRLVHDRRRPPRG